MERRVSIRLTPVFQFSLRHDYFDFNNLAPLAPPPIPCVKYRPYVKYTYQIYSCKRHVRPDDDYRLPVQSEFYVPWSWYLDTCESVQWTHVLSPLTTQLSPFRVDVYYDFSDRIKNKMKKIKKDYRDNIFFFFFWHIRTTYFLALW